MFSQQKIEFLKHIYKNKFVTRKTQKIFHLGGYYLMISFLKNDGLIYCDGKTHDNEKVWKLTPKGTELTKLLIDLEKTQNKIKELMKSG